MRFYTIREMDSLIAYHLDKFDKSAFSLHLPLQYYSQNIDSSINDEIYAKELRVIDVQFEEYGKLLDKYFSSEEIYELRKRFEERAWLWNKFRAEGSDFRIENINRLKSLETTSQGRLELDKLSYKKVHGEIKVEQKIEKDYKLKQLMDTVEQIPIYYESEDFPAPTGNSDQEKDKAFHQIEQKYKDTLENIDKILGSVLGKMYEHLLNKGCLYIRKKEINKVEKIINDLRLRAKLWKIAVSTIICNETGTYNTERFYREQCDVLEELEKTYAQYNGGKGLEALEEVRTRLGWEERQFLNAGETERTVRENETGQSKGKRVINERVCR